MGIKGIIALSLATLSAGLAYYFLKHNKKEKIPKKWEHVGILKRINIYPLKSGNRIELNKAQCTEFGLKQTTTDEEVFQLRDRGLIVYGEKDKEFRTARTYPKLVLIDVGVHDSDHLSIDAPDMRTLYVKIPKSSENQEVNVLMHLKEKVYGIDCGDEAASWFSRYIISKPTGLRLAFHDTSRKRDINKTHKSLLDYYKDLSNDSVGIYSDLSSILLVNQQSVNDLNKRIDTGTNVTAENFRPNLVIDGPQIIPYAEHDWEWVKIGDVVLRNVKECTRCILTTVNPQNGQMNHDREPLRTLETYRMSDGPRKLPIMGINMGVRQQGIIHVGDTVYFAKTEKE